MVFEPEGGPNDEDVSWNLMTWGYYDYPFIPMIDRYKWLETRHMVNVCDRWNLDHTSNLQYAFFNGVGWESWENVWGIWNGINPRDAEATRRVANISNAPSRRSWSAPTGSRSIPCTGTASTPAAGRCGQETVWTIVNRNGYDIAGRQMDVPLTPGMRYFDLYHGVELKPETNGQTATPQLRHGSQRLRRNSGHARRTQRQNQNADAAHGGNDPKAARRFLA